MAPELVTVILYAIDTAFKYANRTDMTQEEKQKQAQRDAVRFAEAYALMQKEISEYVAKESE